MASIRRMSAISLAACVVLVAARVTAQSGALKIVILKGEDAVNIIQQKTAVAPLVEVRDRNNLPVAGAVVTFSVGGGQGATFGGVSTLTVTSNAAGQAVAAGFTPTAAGAIQINATAVFQGQTAIATITQTNVLTAAEAASAAGSGAGAGGAGAGGGGLSNGALIGIGAAGAGAAAVGASVAGQEEPAAPPAPRPLGITSSPASTVVGIVGLTAFSFSVSEADASAAWDFGDGSNGSGVTATHTYTREGSFQVSVRASDGRSASVTVSVGSLSGTWVAPYNLSSCSPTPDRPNCVSAEVWILTQQGTTLSGQWTLEFSTKGPDTSGLTGTISGTRSLSARQGGECERLLAGTVSDDLKTISGQYEFQNANPNCLPRAPISMRWMRQ